MIGTETVASDFGFAGMYHHERSGLNLTLFRAYDPSLGRWLSRDPIGESVGTNLYAYVNNAPTNFVDPLGLNPVVVGIAAVLRGIWFSPHLARGAGLAVTAGTMAAGTYSGPGYSAVKQAAQGAMARQVACNPTSVPLSKAGLDAVKTHLAKMDPAQFNDAMIARLESALAGGKSVSGADMHFYLHELTEAGLMEGGMSYNAAHAAALAEHNVSPFALYAPEVIQANPTDFGIGFKRFWGLP